MKSGGGKKKGSAFERLVAKQIVKTFRHYGIKQHECWRSVLSGGHVMSSGDLAMSDRLLELFPYSVECKFRKRIYWERFLIKRDLRMSSWEEWKWVEQAKEGALKREGLHPILVLKENHGPIYVMNMLDSKRPVLRTLNDFLRPFKKDKKAKVA